MIVIRKERKDKGKGRECYHTTRKKKRIRKCICLDIKLWASIDLQAEARHQSRSEFINDVFKTILGSTKSFLTYELKEKAKQLNYAKFQAANYNSEEEIKKAMEEMKAGR